MIVGASYDIQGSSRAQLHLRQILDAYIEHQKEVVVRRTRFDKEKAEARAHILEGLLIALDHIDESDSHHPC